MKTCKRCLISGRVQGVFYRAHTQAEALRLGLTGWVRNLADGRVEVVACGPAAAVDKLCQWLRRGPSHAIVTAVDCAPVEDEGFGSFEVR